MSLRITVIAVPPSSRNAKEDEVALDEFFAAIGDNDAMRALLERRRAAGATLSDGVECIVLTAAAGRPDTALLRMLLDAGMRADIRSPMFGMSPLFYAARRKTIDNAALLVERGADINATDIDGRTALSVARTVGSTAVAEWLVARGAK